MAEKDGIVFAAADGVASVGVEAPRPTRVGNRLAPEKMRVGGAFGRGESATAEGRILGSRSAIMEGSGS